MTGTTQPGRDQRMSPSAGQPSEDVRLTPDDLTCLVAAAARAPSVHNSQPWQFRVRGSDLELHADPRRMLPQVDPEGREMLISCGAALYGLRLGMRRLGYLPHVELLPDPAQPALIARVRPGARERTTAEEWDLIAAVPHRHTHRGPFAPGRVPARLLDALVRDAAAEGAAVGVPVAAALAAGPLWVGVGVAAGVAAFWWFRPWITKMPRPTSAMTTTTNSSRCLPGESSMACSA